MKTILSKTVLIACLCLSFSNAFAWQDIDKMVHDVRQVEAFHDTLENVIRAKEAEVEQIFWHNQKLQQENLKLITGIWQGIVLGTIIALVYNLVSFFWQSLSSKPTKSASARSKKTRSRKPLETAVLQVV